MISFDQMLKSVERAAQRKEQWRRLEAEVERRKALYEELKVEKERAEAATIAKTNFLTNISHEIRTPMTSILGSADLLLEIGDLEREREDRIEALNSIKRNGAHLLGIINDILDLSKIEARGLELERIRFSPIGVVEDVTSLMRSQADDKGLRFSVQYESEIPETIEGDPRGLKQILVNLIGNAIKFTVRGAATLELRLVSADGDPRIRFSVVDTGIGITEEQRSRLFRPFEQADNSTCRKHGGTGLGLAICKHLANGMGGAIDLKSEPGRGSTFSLELPTGSLEGVRMIREPTTERRVESSAPIRGQGSSERRLLGCRVLVAEDSPDSQRIVRHVLRKAGAQVEIAENGQVAVEGALAARDDGQPFDVILMDMQMPVLDGYEATQTLRRQGYSGMIIALTAHALEGEKQRCLDAGCDDYDTKPLDRERLIEAIRRSLRGFKRDETAAEANDPGESGS